MGEGYFTSEEYGAMETVTAYDALQSAVDKLMALHTRLYGEYQKRAWQLHTGLSQPHRQSACDVEETPAFNLQYLRPKAQALQVERLMGREELTHIRDTQNRRHPLIEVRLTAQGMAIELILSPDAWWDQQNMVGRWTLPQHRAIFYEHLQSLDSLMCLGFWRGVHLGDMHLKASQYQHRRVLDEFLGTFEPNKDWFRLGRWYERHDEALNKANIVTSIVNVVRQLYPLYEFIVWTSDNNYRDFYPAPGSS